jgi:hypothetical protein
VGKRKYLGSLEKLDAALIYLNTSLLFLILFNTFAGSSDYIERKKAGKRQVLLFFTSQVNHPIA